MIEQENYYENIAEKRNHIQRIEKQVKKILEHAEVQPDGEEN